MTPREHYEAAERLLNEWEAGRRELQAWERQFPTSSTAEAWGRLCKVLDAAQLHARLADIHHAHCTGREPEC